LIKIEINLTNKKFAKIIFERSKNLTKDKNSKPEDNVNYESKLTIKKVIETNENKTSNVYKDKDEEAKLLFD
jgi:hypothetical protein